MDISFGNNQYIEQQLRQLCKHYIIREYFGFNNDKCAAYNKVYGDKSDSIIYKEIKDQLPPIIYVCCNMNTNIFHNNVICNINNNFGCHTIRPSSNNIIELNSYYLYTLLTTNGIPINIQLKIIESSINVLENDKIVNYNINNGTHISRDPYYGQISDIDFFNNIYHNSSETPVLCEHQKIQFLKTETINNRNMLVYYFNVQKYCKECTFAAHNKGNKISKELLFELLKSDNIFRTMDLFRNMSLPYRFSKSYADINEQVDAIIEKVLDKKIPQYLESKTLMILRNNDALINNGDMNNDINADNADNSNNYNNCNKGDNKCIKAVEVIAEDKTKKIKKEILDLFNDNYIDANIMHRLLKALE